MSAQQELQELLVQMNELLEKAKQIAQENELRFSVGNIHFSPLNHGPPWTSKDDYTVYIESDWYDSGC